MGALDKSRFTALLCLQSASAQGGPSPRCKESSFGGWPYSGSAPGTFLRAGYAESKIRCDFGAARLRIMIS